MRVSVSEKEKSNPLYWKMLRRWWGIMERCYNTECVAYKGYGGRGIKVSKEWHDFGVFLKDVGYPPFEKASLDRVNNDGDYELSNIRWANSFQQASNTRRNRFIEYNGQRHTLAEWARIRSITPSCIRHRLNRGYSVGIALGYVKEKTISFNGKNLTIREWAKYANIRPDLLSKRLRSGWSFEKAINTPYHNNKGRSGDLYSYRGKSLTVVEWALLYKMNSTTLRSRLKAGWSFKKAITTPLREKLT
jgi:hypothetical protein